MGWATNGLDGLGDSAAILAVLPPQPGRDGAPPRLRFEHVNEVGAAGMGAPAEALLGQCLDEIAPELVGIGDWQHVMEVAVTGVADSWFSYHLGAWHELRCAEVPPMEGVPEDPTVLRYLIMSSRQVTGIDLASTPGQNGAATGTTSSTATPADGVSRAGGLLLQISRRLGMAVTEADVAEVVADVVAPALGAGHGLLAVPQDDGRVRTMCRDAGEPLRGLVTRLLPRDGDDAIMRSLRAGQPVVEPHGEHLLTAIPLRARGETVGVLSVSSQAPLPAWQNRADVIDTVASLVAQAVQRAALYEAQLHANLAMQHALLPPGIPEVDGMDVAVRYRPGSGEEVGGDWYDVVPLASGATAFVIGDVQGHDLAAAAIMGQMRSVVRAYLLDLQPPSSALSGANAFLQSLGADRLVTCCVALTHPSARLVTVASAGHCAPVLVPQDGEAGLLTIDVGPPLGVATGAPCRERTLPVPPGAQLLLYTDGLVERRSRSYSEGEKQLVAGLTGHAADSPEQLAERALTAAGVESDGELRSSGRVLEDDAALVAVRWTGDAEQQHAQTRDLPVAAESAVIARWFVGDVLAAWAVDEDAADLAVLLTNELVANAVRHAHRTIKLTVSVDDTRVRVSVFDDSHREPRLVQPDEFATSGRGLQLVDSLASHWGVTGAEGDLGKSVWFELDR